VLTFSCARAVRRSSCTARLAAAALAVTVSIAILHPARADGIAVGGCLGDWRSLNTTNCVVRWGDADNPFVRTVPQPANPEERARDAEREHKWQQRCKPVIAQDYYGVSRYRYAAPGCEFGVID
jgi:hypothetical protein